MSESNEIPRGQRIRMSIPWSHWWGDARGEPRRLKVRKTGQLRLMQVDQ